MHTHARHNSRAHRPLGAVALLAAGAATIAWLCPGGPGTAGATEVTQGPSASAYRSVTAATADAPAWTGPLLEAATEGTLVILGLLLVLLGRTALRRKDADAVAAAVLIGVATVAAYAISEAAKAIVDQERPCRAIPTVETIAPCPATGDWSFPSNHATLAAALAVGLAVRRPHLAVVTLPLAAAAALLRVLVGVHYPHDVLAGAILGGTVAAAVLLAAPAPLDARCATSRAATRGDR